MYFPAFSFKTEGMNHTNRRNWLKTVALGGGFSLLESATPLWAKPNTYPLNYSGLVKLNANENPYGPSAMVRQAIKNELDLACRYPSAYLSELTQKIAYKEEIDPKCVVITGGSTEGLKASGLLFGSNGREIIAADPTFQALLTYAENLGSYVHRVPLTPDFKHDLEAMEKRINQNTGLIFICNPNNPTGTLLDSDKLIDFIKSNENRSVIFSDEAYYDYISLPEYPSMIDLVREGRNVIVSKTFSKVYGLAGMRIGYLLARPDIADRLKKVVMANTNVLAIIAAKSAIDDSDFYKFSIEKNELAKNAIYSELEKLSIPHIISHTNFVFFKSGLSVSELNNRLLKKNIQIGRPFPPLIDWARVSTGTLESVNQFLIGLRQVL